jgi:PAS domain S-box-containing protein
MIGKNTFIEFFKISSTASLILKTDTPKFTIAEVNDAFLAATKSKRDDLMGKGIFEVFPANDSDNATDCDSNLTLSSLNTVLKTHKKHQTAIQKYYIPIRGTSEFELKYWESESIPLFDDDGKLKFIIHCITDVTEVKKAKELIEKSNERFAYVTKATSDAIWDWDFENNLVYRAEGFKTIFGFDIEELNLPDNTWENYIHPEDKQSATKSIQDKIDSSGNYWKHDYRIIKPNGNVAFVQDSAYIIRDKNNNVTRIIGAIKDITKKKQEELRLKLLESVITNTDDSILITEAEPFGQPGPRIIYVNEAFTRMTGYTAEEVIGKTPRILQGPKTDQAELKKIGKALRQWKSCEATVINYKKSGEEFWIQMSINPVADESGYFTHWIAIERDVTEQKKREKELLVTTLRLFDALESIQDGFYTLDNNWNVTYWNQLAEKLSGRTEEEMIGKNFWEVYKGSISEKIITTFHKAKTHNKPIRIEVYSKQAKNWLEINAFPSDMGLTVYFKNITERKHTESKLKKTNKSLEKHINELAISNEELERFAYVASHDLQEPLRMVTSFLSQIEKKYENALDEKGKKYIFFAVDGAKRMRQIILDLLNFSRVGKKEGKYEEVDLNTIIDEITVLYGKQIEDKKAQILCEVLPTIKTHAVPIKQVFQNLIDNALKYSKPNERPVITISCKKGPAVWEFEIKDNGIGISQEYFDKIFIIFQRLHSKEDYSGTGIGLAITKKIIENLNGQIWVKSEEGKGTSFYFTIPKK